MVGRPGRGRGLALLVAAGALVSTVAVGTTSDSGFGLDRLVGTGNSRVTVAAALTASPASGLLPAGTRAISLTVTSPVATSCRYAPSADTTWATMTPFDSGAGSTTHVTALSITPDPSVVSMAVVRCANDVARPMTLRWRPLPSQEPGWPRIGNLWGWPGFAGASDEELARVDLWLGAEPTAAQASRLRRVNPAVRLLASYNAVEWGDGLPSEYYLTDPDGKRVEVWPGAYRLNITRPEVADFLADHAYRIILDSGLRYDGLFIDNVMASMSWQTTDIHGTPFRADSDGDGVADPAAVLDARWRAGLLRELRRVRTLLPNAMLVNHSVEHTDPQLMAFFDGTSIGFDVPNVKEGKPRWRGGPAATYTDLETRYRAWSTTARPLTMVESAVPSMLGYGYGFQPERAIPPSTLEFARTFYPYVRFGFGVTLMRDGYFAHEFGDTWHGNRWWYDEMKVELGTPTGPARRVLKPASTTELIRNGDAESGTTGWTLWTDPGYAATLSARAAPGAPAGPQALRVEVGTAGSTRGGVELYQPGLRLVAGQDYELSFSARADRQRTLGLGVAKQVADWRGYGLEATTSVGTAWKRSTVRFTASATADDAKLQLLAGDRAGWLELDGISVKQAAPDVLRRDFSAGTVLLNATGSTVTVPVGTGLRRMTGSQAPADQRIVDDADRGFTTTGTWTKDTLDSGDWKASGPYFHDWGAGSRRSAPAGAGGGASTATWNLAIPAADTYQVSVWWPAAPSASAWSPSARYEVVSGGTVVASATLDQRTGGDTWHSVGRTRLQPGATLRLICPGPAPCVADAVLLSSARRYNDGSVARSVTLAPFDAAVLVRG